MSVPLPSQFKRSLEHLLLVLEEARADAEGQRRLLSAVGSDVRLSSPNPSKKGLEAGFETNAASPQEAVTELSSLNVQLESFRASDANLRRSLATAKAEVLERTTELSEARSQREQIEEQVRSFAVERSSLSDALAEARAQVGVLEGKLTDATNAAAHNITTLETTRLQLGRDAEELKSECGLLQAKLQEALTNAADAANRAINLEDELKAQRHQAAGNNWGWWSLTVVVVAITASIGLRVAAMG